MTKEISKEARTRMEHSIEDFLKKLATERTDQAKLIRIPIPPLTEERRKQLAKHVGEIAEEHRTAVRNIRRDSNEKLKKALKEKTISEDEEKDGLADIQKLTDLHTAKIGELAKHKEDEVLKV